MRAAGLIFAASAAVALSQLVPPAWANDPPAILAPADGATVSSPDGKKGTLQIVYGLLCAPDGCPVAVSKVA